ncbi:MAG: N-acetylmuramoyl-L-alanine amidase [Hyphomicrobiaceae bacterium]
MQEAGIRRFALVARFVAAVAAVLLGQGLWAPPLLASALIADGAAIAAKSGTTTFRLGLSGKANFTATALANPYRIVVELPNIDFKLDDGAGTKGGGLIEKFRFGASAPGKSRIVLHLTGPAKIKRAEIVPRASGSPLAFEIELVATDSQHFTEVAATATPGEDAFPILTPPKPGEIDECKIRQLVVLDPGHGGIDSGAVSPKGTKEKDMVLAFALLLRDKLKSTGRYRVLMTRDTDIFIPLKQRVAFAASNRACLFLSLHADSADDRRYQGVRGGTVYTRSDRASDEEAARTALKENAADEAAGMSVPSEEVDPVSNWLEELWGQETAAHNTWLANILVPELRRKTKMTREPHRQAAFYVLKSPLTPSALIELGFISNRQDEQELKSETWRAQVASGIVAAIDRFFKERRERPSDAWLPAEN